MAHRPNGVRVAWQPPASAARMSGTIMNPTKSERRSGLIRGIKPRTPTKESTSFKMFLGTKIDVVLNQRRVAVPLPRGGLAAVSTAKSTSDPRSINGHPTEAPWKEKRQKAWDEHGTRNEPRTNSSGALGRLVVWCPLPNSIPCWTSGGIGFESGDGREDGPSRIIDALRVCARRVGQANENRGDHPGPLRFNPSSR
ncbi:hypothetical protein Isop_0529 [Isosphaera pallida ATCC 43644]|uniref:Uncharacterized protein n=1 Tax=Isosphaera pallida (strain ATCC 43644 / DSM 9630 / IS1B) TaxID=575540 RepID=E8QZJ5_ISOPI|nr:hypothetical protein Isop_0529 [Isosphaera pallida ATCC 43644]